MRFVELRTAASAHPCTAALSQHNIYTAEWEIGEKLLMPQKWSIDQGQAFLFTGVLVRVSATLQPLFPAYTLPVGDTDFRVGIIPIISHVDL